MELSLAFIATKLSGSHSVALRDPEGYFVDFKGFRRFPKLPAFHSTRLWTTKRSPTNYAGTLPIVTSASFKAMEASAEVEGIIWIGNSEPPKGIYAIWITSKASAIDVLDEVLDLLEFYSEWNARVRNALLERADIPDVIQMLGEVTDNPYWYADPALRVMQISEDRSLSKYSPKWDYQLKTGRYPAEVVSRIVSSGDLEKMNRHSRAWLFDDSESYTIPFVTKTVFLNGAVYGYLFVIQLNPESCICDLELAEVLGNLVATYVQHGNLGLSGTKRFAEQMLRTCIAGNDVSDDERAELLDMLGWSGSKTYIVAAFDRQNEKNGTAEAPQAQVELIRERLSFGSVFAYDVYIIFVTPVQGRSSFEVEQRIDEACSKLGWKAGVSDEFSDFSALADYYGQAQIALQKGLSLSREDNVYPYRKYSLAYICQKLALGTERALYMHPDVERLIEHDRKSDSELVATLDAYLSNERNISKTAKDLFLHRNSVIYRIDKIKSIMATDLDDNNNRIALQISLCMWAYNRR